MIKLCILKYVAFLLLCISIIIVCGCSSHFVGTNAKFLQKPIADKALILCKNVDSQSFRNCSPKFSVVSINTTGNVGWTIADFSGHTAQWYYIDGIEAMAGVNIIRVEQDGELIGNEFFRYKNTISAVIEPGNIYAFCAISNSVNSPINVSLEKVGSYTADYMSKNKLDFADKKSGTPFFPFKIVKFNP